MKLSYSRQIGYLREKQRYEENYPETGKQYLTSRDFYTRYKQNGGDKSYETFFRELRKVIETARRRGVKIIGDNKGFRIAANEAEWYEYVRKKKNTLISEIETLASCSNRTVTSFVQETFFGNGRKKKKEEGKETIGLFDEFAGERG